MSIGKARIVVSLVLGLALIVVAVVFAVRDDGQSGSGSAPLSGIDADTLRVGYPVPETHGPWGPAPGESAAELQAGIQAVVDAVNSEGRSDGRVIEPEYLPFLAGQSSRAEALQRCVDLTADEGVFAVVLASTNPTEALQCYADANTIVVDQSTTPHDQDRLERFAPYLWAPSSPEYGSFLRAQLEVLRADGFLAANDRVQLIASSSDLAQRAIADVAEPFLSDLGAGPVRVDEVEAWQEGDLDAILAEVKRAIEAGKASEVNRVLVVGGDRLLPWSLSTFEARDSEARWAVSTFDTPAFLAEHPESIQSRLRLGMVGLGFAPLDDVAGDRDAPEPDNPTRTWCGDVLDAAGITPGRSRAAWRLLMQYCDSTLFLAGALDNVGAGDTVTAQDFAAGVAELSDSLPSATALGSSWAPGRYAAVDTVRPLRWEPDCECFEYFGEPHRLYP